MQVKELADLAGTTVRTVRYYHQIGLLPVPPTRNGHRHYDLVHVARLTRIRWLAQAGIPLTRIGAMLEDPAGPGTVVADLRATLAALDDELAQLSNQRDRIGRLVAAAEAGEHLSPLPPSAARFYDDLEQRATDERVRRQISRERHFMELAWYRGDMPPEAGVIYDRLVDDEAGLADSLRSFGRLAARSARPASAEGAADEAAADVMDRLRRQLGDDFARLARTIDPELTRRAAELYLRVSDPGERPVNQAVVEALLAALTEARA